MSFTREQLLERKQRLGASEAAAALGLSPWCSPLQLWQDKIAPDVPPPLALDNPHVEWGVRLESVVLAKYCEAHDVTPIEAPAAWRVAENYPWLGCTPDAVLPDRLLEIKTASSARDWGEPGTDQIPVSYVVQCTQQMLVTGLLRCDVAVLIAGHDYREYTLGFDVELGKELIERTWAFWRHVVARTPPDVHSIADAARRWPRHVAGTIKVADNDTLDALDALRTIKQHQTELEHEAEALGVEVRKAIGDAEGLTDVAGRVLATWKAQDRTTFDTVAFKKVFPEHYAAFSRVQSSRVFRLTTE